MTWDARTLALEVAVEFQQHVADWEHALAQPRRQRRERCERDRIDERRWYAAQQRRIVGQRNCDHCGRLFQLNKIQLKGRVRMCSTACARKAPRTRGALSHAGLTLSLGEWARRLGLNYWTVHGRLRRGWPLERALATATGAP